MINIFDIQYFANSYYYLNLFSSTHVILEQYVFYDKVNFSNRCIIAGANGAIPLSVPLEKGRAQRTVFKDVMISGEENWQKRHWRSILSSYNGSPWFQFYADSLSALYQRPCKFLLDWNLACLDWSLRKLNKEITYELTREYKTSYAGGEIIDLRKQGSKKAFEPRAKVIRYNQVFDARTGFIPGLSILDLLFCEGPVKAVGLLENP